MKYDFIMNICTDGDFGFTLIPRDMRYDGCGRYILERSYDSREDALNDIAHTFDSLNRQLITVNDTIKSIWLNYLTRFKDKLSSSSSSVDEYVCHGLGGNYDGTHITFRSLPNNISIKMSLTDEEYSLIQRNRDKVTIDQIVATILELYKSVDNDSN